VKESLENPDISKFGMCYFKIKVMLFQSLGHVISKYQLLQCIKQMGWCKENSGTCRRFQTTPNGRRDYTLVRLGN